MIVHPEYLETNPHLFREKLSYFEVWDGMVFPTKKNQVLNPYLRAMLRPHMGTSPHDRNGWFGQLSQNDRLLQLGEFLQFIHKSDVISMFGKSNRGCDSKLLTPILESWEK